MVTYRTKRHRPHSLKEGSTNWQVGQILGFYNMRVHELQTVLLMEISFFSGYPYEMDVSSFPCITVINDFHSFIRFFANLILAL